ncbi:MAG: DUF4860 domain-containing protein [Angelakisella sp.]|nr:DUF4860 domain-containing protein [Angelakisella sp.]
MRINGDRGHLIDFLFTLALFCVFALSALTVVIIGADVYKSTVSEMNRSFNSRISVTYISEKIRQHDSLGAVSVQIFGDGDAIVLRQTVEGAAYLTYIYSHEGKLCELVASESLEMKPSDGQSIMEIQSFSATQLENGLIKINIAGTGGFAAEAAVSPRCS